MPAQKKKTPEKKALKTSMPATLGGCADALWGLRLQRQELQRQVAEIEAQESKLRAHIILVLPKSEATGVSGKLCRVEVVNKIVAEVKDWTALYAFIKKSDAFELLHRRVTDTAVRERWEAGQLVPGVQALKVPTVSIHAL